MTRLRGFSLVEVLIAAAVMAVVAVGLGGGISGLLAHETSYHDRTQICLLARSLAGEIELNGIPERPDGEFESHPGYRWNVTHEPLREAAGLEKEALLKEVTMTITSPTTASQSFRLLAR